MRELEPFEPVSPPRRSLLLRLLIFAPALAVAFYLGLSWRLLDGGGLAQPAAAPRATADATLQQAELATIELFREASPAVVYITTLARRRYPFDRRVFEVPSGTGSGFIWDRDGHVVTNFHVVQGARLGERVLVRLSDQSEWDAKIMGWAPDKDLAVLKIDAPRERLPALPLGRSRELQVGQSIFAIGNPFGLDQTLTTGVISALGREIESIARIPIRDVIQCDAAINPGNSGGPLLDSSGHLIGVNTMIYSPSGASAGIGFAIPVDTVNWVVPDLIRYGVVNRPYLGINDYDDRVIRRYGLEGVLITAIETDSGAGRAGLRGTTRNRLGETVMGDIITAIEGEPIRSFDDLYLLLEKYRPGDRVELTILREGQERKLEVELDPPRRLR
jgi:S1-C subfamily serine protease